MNPKKERFRHLSYCMLCAHQKFVPVKGIVCGLDNLRASFKGDCASFDFDADVAYGHHQKLIKSLKEEYIDQDFLEALLSPKRYTHEVGEYFEVKSVAKSHGKSYRSPYHFRQVMLVLAVGIALMSWGYSVREEGEPPYWSIIVGGLTFVVVVLQLLYLLFVLDVKGPLIASTDVEGFRFENEFYFWNEIVTAGIRSQREGEHNSVFLVVGTISRGIRELEFGNTLYCSQLLGAIRANQNPVWRMLEERSLGVNPKGA